MAPMFFDIPADTNDYGGTGAGPVVPDGADAVFHSAGLPVFGAESIIFHVTSSDAYEVSMLLTDESTEAIVADRTQAAGMLEGHLLAAAGALAEGCHVDALVDVSNEQTGSPTADDKEVAVADVGDFEAADPIAGAGIPAGATVAGVAGFTRTASGGDGESALALCGLQSTSKQGRPRVGQGISGTGVDTGTVLTSVGVVCEGIFTSGETFVGLADREDMDDIAAGVGCYAHDLTTSTDDEWQPVVSLGEADVAELTEGVASFDPVSPEHFPIGAEVWGVGLPLSSHVIANDGTTVTLDHAALSSVEAADIVVAGFTLTSAAVASDTGDCEFAMVELSKPLTDDISAGTVTLASITLSVAATATGAEVDIWTPAIVTLSAAAEASGATDVTVTGSDFDAEDIEFNNSADGTGPWVSHTEVNGDLAGTLVAKKLGANGRPLCFFPTAGQVIPWRLARLKATVTNGQPGVPGVRCQGYVTINDAVSASKPTLLPMVA